MAAHPNHIRSLLFALPALLAIFGAPSAWTQIRTGSRGAPPPADTFSMLQERLPQSGENPELLVEICSQYTMRGAFDSIHPYAARLRRIGSERGEERWSVYADFYSGQSYLLAEGSDSIRIYLDKALAGALGIRDSVALCRIYNALGIYATSIEMDYHGGIDYFLRAMSYARSDSMKIFRLTAQCNLANAYYMRNDPAGLNYAEDVRRLATELGHEYIAFGGTVICAYMHYLLGDYPRALEYIRQSLPDTERFGYHTELYSLYANILHAEGNDAQADKYYRLALGHVNEQIATAAMMTYLSYASYLIDLGRADEAVPVLRKGIAISDRSNNTTYRYKLFLRLSEAESARGRYRSALECFRRYHEEADSIFNLERERSINELRIKYEAEKQANELRRNKIEMIQQQSRNQRLLTALLLFAGVTLFIGILYRRKEQMYRRIVRQQYEFLQQQRRTQHEALCDERLSRAAGSDRAEQEQTLFRRIERLMQTDRLYRLSNLTVDRLAERLETNRTYVSRAINQQAGKTFSSYVNHYRIQEAVERLSDADDGISLKALAQVLGYNHLQTFYASFRSVIGMTPSDYRKQFLKMHKEHTL